MLRILALPALLALLGSCKGSHNGAYELQRDVKRDTTSMTGVAGGTLPSLADAKPALSVTCANAAVGDGIKAALDASPIAKRAAVTVTATLDPASPGDSGTLDAKLAVTGLFGHAPEVTKLEGTLTVHLAYTNVPAQKLGSELGGAIVDWFASEKIPTGSAPAITRVTRIAAGPPHCSLHEDGVVRCWGLHGKEALPIPKAAGSIAIDAANNFGACGVRKDGHVWCMDAWDGPTNLELRDVCGISTAKDVSVAQSTACALLETGHVACWARGAQSFAPCGDKPMIAEIAGIDDAIAIEAGAFESCAIRKDGSVACWENCGKDCKSGVVGQLDPTATAPRAAAVKRLAAVKQLVIIYQPCGLVGDDRVVCAANADLKGSETTLPEPVKRLMRGRNGPCALTTKGNVYCWDGSGAPVKIDGVADLLEANGGIGGMCGATAKNTLVCWGGMSGSEPPVPVAL